MKMPFSPRRGPRSLALLPAVTLATLAGAADMTPEQRAFFENKIRPVLVRHCYECHSVRSKKIGGKLLLDSPAEMIGGGESGPAMIPGKPDESLIIRALRYEELEMPPKHRLPQPVVNDFISWVRMGAPDPRDHAPRVAGNPPTADRAALWSYQPVTTPEAPKVRATDWPRDPLDAFVLARIEAAGLKATGDASPATLVRRLHYDLVGLPPSAEITESFLQAAAGTPESRTRAVEGLVDRLLSSPLFGERWGRHWLDVARYAESNGNDGLSRNPSFPHAWRYRDYVIRALNDDVPYDRFITEQLAGDLLPASDPAERDRLLVATGLLALAAKPAKAMNDNFEMDVVADQIQVVGSGILGLSVGCARCHDHKTDPIPARDYYALAGIFKSTETLWGAAAHQALSAPQTPLHELRAAPAVHPHPAIEAVVRAHPPKRPPAKPSFAHAPGTPLAMGAREARNIGDCKLNIDGDSKKPGPVVPRGFLSACGPVGQELRIDPRQSGRLELARWLTRPNHPQTARVLVNRVWLLLFGEGLVRTPDDFGASGERPTHPELLDHLASGFVNDGWSIKRLIRRIVLSRTYQLDSRDATGLRAADPDNLLLARHQRRRLDAEALRDTMLAASGDLDLRPGSGSLIQHRDVLINELPPLHQPSRHRSVYLLMLRNSMPPELTPFNLPDATTVTGRRDTSTLATQSLHLLNSPFLVEQSRRFAARLPGPPADDETRIRAAYRLALAREPGEAELRRAGDFIRDARLALASTTSALPAHGSDAWAAFCQALLASSELRYVD